MDSKITVEEHSSKTTSDNDHVFNSKHKHKQICEKINHYNKPNQLNE